MICLFDKDSLASWTSMVWIISHGIQRVQQKAGGKTWCFEPWAKTIREEYRDPTPTPPNLNSTPTPQEPPHLMELESPSENLQQWGFRSSATRWRMDGQLRQDWKKTTAIDLEHARNNRISWNYTVNVDGKRTWPITRKSTDLKAPNFKSHPLWVAKPCNSG